jgi:hypothetical protein
MIFSATTIKALKGSCLFFLTVSTTEYMTESFGAIFELNFLFNRKWRIALSPAKAVWEKPCFCLIHSPATPF